VTPGLKVARFAALGALAAAASLGNALAAAAGAAHVDGADLDAPWAIPFVGLLLSIAIMPLATPKLWHHHYGKIAAAWAAAFIVPFAAIYGTDIAIYEFLHVMLLDYVPFIVLLFALYTISGGVLLDGHIKGTPWTNTGMLAGGTAIASITGTTGASVLLIRPMLRANAGRSYNVHVFVFFIFLVSNIGGSLTPLGDPPLYLGFLKGVDFFWPTVNLLSKTLLIAAILLAVFFVLDSAVYIRDAHKRAQEPQRDTAPIKLKGKLNIFLLAVVIAVILASAIWKTDAAIDVMGVHVDFPNIARVVALLGLAALSLWLTPLAVRQGNDFTWAPIAEVGKLFAGIFVTIVPVLAMLKAGTEGAFAPLLTLLTGPDGQPNNAAYFWLTGGLSSFLDNAPTYLVFFNAAGGDPQVLMTTLSTTLIAISAGAVFMGANTYIGNAPNFMVKAICEEAGIKMPSFFGYMGWSIVFLLPCFALVTWLYFL
jgi:Na+/H+ antiporter NhaD/arsenite permease-like protein